MSARLQHPLRQGRANGEEALLKSQLKKDVVGFLRPLLILPLSVVQMLSVPSISLFGHECLEGREITMDSEVPSLVEEGFNNHIMSIRVNSGWCVLVLGHVLFCVFAFPLS